MPDLQKLLPPPLRRPPKPGHSNGAGDGATAYREGGWSYDDLESGFAEAVGELQTVGEKFPPLPEELQRP